VLSSDDLLESAETIAITGEEARAAIANATVLDDGVERPTSPRAPAAPSQRVTVPRDSVTEIDQSARAAVETTRRDGATVIVNDTVNETVMRSGAFKPQVAGGPAALPTMVGQPPLERRRTPVPLETTGRLPRRGPRLALAIGGLFGIAVLSFLIALAARGSGKGFVAAPPDAAAGSAREVAIDASTLASPPIDAPPDGPTDAFEPTIRPDAADDLTYLEVHTNPSGGTITINGEARTDPAKFALPPGHYEILAELDGYQPEHRVVDLDKHFDRVQDIAFRKRIPTGRPPPPTGKLTVRTTPYSVVFNGPKKLGETPFADVELPAGTYTLTFKNPDRTTVTRKVVITAGKTTKLSITLP
jgi:hypothetical protein